MPFSKEQAAGETLYCIVCGEGSCRRNWARNRKIGNKQFVACSRHTDAEYSKAFQKALIRQGKTLTGPVGPPPNDPKGKN